MQVCVSSVCAYLLSDAMTTMSSQDACVLECQPCRARAMYSLILFAAVHNSSSSPETLVLLQPATHKLTKGSDNRLNLSLRVNQWL